VRDPATESVQTFDDLLEDGMAFPWNVNALAANPAEADRIATSLAALPSVDHTLTLSDYVPDDQEEKLAILDDVGFLLLPTLEPDETRPVPTTAEQLAALRALESELTAMAGAPVAPELAEAAARLAGALGAFREAAGEGASAKPEIAALQASLLDTLPGQLRVLRRSLGAGPVETSDLPAHLRRQTVALDGRVRVEVFPSEDLNDNAALARYVESVSATAPRAFGEGIVIHESGRIVVRAFRQALATAAVLVALSLLLMWRKLLDAALAALPLTLASLFTVASSVLLDVHFNYANVIVIPLLLGMGVDTGIHLVHRLRYEALPGGNLLRTSTARAVFLSAATTIASFGTLGFTTHRGMASLGQLLTLGITWILVCNLLVLPVVVALARLGGGGAPGASGRGSR
jgi:hopanoid biosynthesis associated RND transporter like protein HpnN